MWAFLPALMVSAVSPASARVVVIGEEDVVRGEATTLDDSGQLTVHTADGKKVERTLGDSLMIQMTPVPRVRSPRTWVYTSDGQRLSGHDLTVGPEALSLTLRSGRPAEFPLDDVTAIAFKTTYPEFTSWPEEDTRIVQANGDVMDVPFAELTETGVIADIDPSVDPILLPLERVQAILWPRVLWEEAERGDAQGGTGRDALVMLAEGERIRGRLVALSPARITLDTGAARLEISVREVDSLWLGRAKPVGIDRASVTLSAEGTSTNPGGDERPRLRVNANGLGGPLRVGSRMYGEGMGLRGATSVRLAVPRGARWFLASVGVDTNAAKFARVTFSATSEAGGEAVVKNVAHGEPARPLAVLVEGGSTLTLSIAPEHGSETACLGDFVDAKFIVVEP